MKHTPTASSTILNFDQDDEQIDTSVRQALLRESDHLARSEQLLDEQYDLASRARENLVNQRSAIRSMTNQFNGITSRFQAVNILVKKIGIRKRRDTLIVALVFCICLFLLLLKLF